jgi:hypothetical protein
MTSSIAATKIGVGAGRVMGLCCRLMTRLGIRYVLETLLKPVKYIDQEFIDSISIAPI